MNPMKRLGLVALLAVGVTLFASTPARAAGGENWGTVQLTNAGDEPQASGEASLKSVKVLSSWIDDWGQTREYCSGNLSVKCQNLTPGALYWTPVGIFIANRKGEGGTSGKVVFNVTWYDGPNGPVLGEPYAVYVVRRDPTEFSYDETLVLMGQFGPPWCLDY